MQVFCPSKLGKGSNSTNLKKKQNKQKVSERKLNLKKNNQVSQEVSERLPNVRFSHMTYTNHVLITSPLKPPPIGILSLLTNMLSILQRVKTTLDAWMSSMIFFKVVLWTVVKYCTWIECCWSIAQTSAVQCHLDPRGWILRPSLKLVSLRVLQLCIQRLLIFPWVVFGTC